jgi:hypothetical protein
MRWGTHVEDDDDRCLCIGNPQENVFIADHCDVDDLKEASHTIRRTITVGICTLTLQPLSLMLIIL